MSKYTNESERYNAVIEEDENVGFYLYIYDKLTGKCLFDFLQDTLEIAIIQAEKDFSIDSSAWIKAK